ncbi:hypothetical protein Pelo_18026 [Pelomyxa schiedti]|nr:hypothetical protein Pelo_18026 [Pelomyxa schiedti]
MCRTHRRKSVSEMYPTRNVQDTSPKVSFGDVSPGNVQDTSPKLTFGDVSHRKCSPKVSFGYCPRMGHFYEAVCVAGSEASFTKRLYTKSPCSTHVTWTEEVEYLQFPQITHGFQIRHLEQGAMGHLVDTMLKTGVDQSLLPICVVPLTADDATRTYLCFDGNHRRFAAPICDFVTSCKKQGIPVLTEASADFFFNMTLPQTRIPARIYCTNVTNDIMQNISFLAGMKNSTETNYLCKARIIYHLRYPAVQYPAAKSAVKPWKEVIESPVVQNMRIKSEKVACEYVQLYEDLDVATQEKLFDLLAQYPHCLVLKFNVLYKKAALFRSATATGSLSCRHLPSNPLRRTYHPVSRNSFSDPNRPPARERTPAEIDAELALIEVPSDDEKDTEWATSPFLPPVSFLPPYDVKVYHNCTHLKTSINELPGPAKDSNTEKKTGVCTHSSSRTSSTTKKTSASDEDQP